MEEKAVSSSATGWAGRHPPLRPGSPEGCALREEKGIFSSCHTGHCYEQVRPLSVALGTDQPWQARAGHHVSPLHGGAPSEASSPGHQEVLMYVTHTLFFIEFTGCHWLIR